MTDNQMHRLSRLAREVAKQAKHDPTQNDAADTLYVVCVKLGVPENLLPK